MLESYHTSDIIEAGCDEAGRGCLAGPVFAAAVILPSTYCNSLLNDSKQLSKKNRDLLRKEIEEAALSFSVSYMNNESIDAVNIFKASMYAMHKALDNLNPLPGHIIVDGNHFIKYREIPYTCIVKGDCKYYSIAAASVLAKTYRDEFMCKIHKEYPGYGWERNKGYGTREHRKAILKTGISKYHRRSFKLFDNQLKIDFVNSNNSVEEK